MSRVEQMLRFTNSWLDQCSSVWYWRVCFLNQEEGSRLKKYIDDIDTISNPPILYKSINLMGYIAEKRSRGVYLCHVRVNIRDEEGNTLRGNDALTTSESSLPIITDSLFATK